MPMINPLVMGLDPSLTGTGICVANKDGIVKHSETVSTDADMEILARIAKIICRVKGVIQEYNPQLIGIEGLSFSSQGDAVHKLAGLHFIIRWELSLLGVKVLVLPPKTIKKHVTGKGIAKKSAIAVAVYKEWGREFVSEDEADAFCVAMTGWAWLEGKIKPETTKKKGAKK